MSDSSDSGSGSEEVLTYKCRLCAGSSFTAAELDGHRRRHIEAGELKRKNTARRSGSPGPSSVLTLFEERVENDDEGAAEGERGSQDSPRNPKRPKEPEAGEKAEKKTKKKKGHYEVRRKIRTNKNYKSQVRPRKYPGA